MYASLGGSEAAHSQGIFARFSIGLDVIQMHGLIFMIEASVHMAVNNCLCSTQRVKGWKWSRRDFGPCGLGVGLGI